MLDWNVPFPEKPVFLASLARSDEAGVHAALVEAWTKFLDELATLAADDWSIIVAYLTTEVGSVSLYPASRERPGHEADRPSLSLDVEDWMLAYAAISDAYYEGIDPDDHETSPSPKAEAKFGRQYKALLRGMAGSVKAAIDDPSVAPRFKALKAREGFGVYYVDQGETVHTANLVFLWGNRPPKAFPADTPKVLFTGLMNKASIHPPDVMKCDGDDVIEATFFGAEFNDTYVDILESVPDVGALCRRLKLIHLKYAAIGPVGAERLRKLFPRAKIRVTTMLKKGRS